jgi:hypothetical protein
MIDAALFVLVVGAVTLALAVDVMAAIGWMWQQWRERAR